MNMSATKPARSRNCRSLTHIPSATAPPFRQSMPLRARPDFSDCPPTSTSTGTFVRDLIASAHLDARASTLRQRIEKLARLQANWDGEGAPAPSASAVALAHRLLAICIEVDYIPEQVFAELEGGMGATFLRRHVDASCDHDTPAYATIGFENKGASALLIDDRSQKDIIAEDIATDNASLRRAVSRLKAHFEG